MKRRKALQLFSTASAAVATGSVLGAPGTQKGALDEVRSNSGNNKDGVAKAKSGMSPSSNASAFVGPGVESVTGQAVYSLPRDHAWHGGSFYKSNDFNEWHYITILGRDVNTGERI